MGEVVRLNQNPGDEDSWWIAGGGTQEEAEAACDPESLAPLVPWERTVKNPQEAAALDDLSTALWSIVQATGAADTSVTLAADALLGDAVGSDDFTDAAATVALIQDIRRRLQVVEQYLTKRLGESAIEVHQKGGTLPDGRVWEVKRGKVRKAWDHESWKHDARAKVTATTLGALTPVTGAKVVAVVTDQGEAIDVNLGAVIIAAITAAQEVHGSTPPRVTQLRALGMDPDEYAESKAGLWGLAVASPDPTTTNTPED